MYIILFSVSFCGIGQEEDITASWLKPWHIRENC